MKLNKIIVSLGLAAACVSAASFAATDLSVPTNGKIEIQGELVNSACGLTADSSPVKINFYQVPTGSLKIGQEYTNSESRKVIKLQDCDFATAKTAQVTYTPNTTSVNDKTLAAITGAAQGIGVGIRDNHSNLVEWGQPSAAVNIVGSDLEIPFSAFLKIDNASGTVVPGAFQSQINFKIEYQ